MRLLAVNLTTESRGPAHFVRCCPSICVLLLILSVLFSPTQCKDIKVGGAAGWTHTASYTDLEAVVGDRLVSLLKFAVRSAGQGTPAKLQLVCTTAVRVGRRLAERSGVKET